MGGQVRHLGAVEEDAPAVGRQGAGDLADERGLAGAVGANERVYLAARDLERHIVGGDDAAEALAHAAQLEHGGLISPWGGQRGRRCLPAPA